MKTEILISGTMSFSEVLGKISAAFVAGGWSYDWTGDDLRGIKVSPPTSDSNLGKLEVELFYPPDINHIFDSPCLLVKIKGGNNDNRPVTVGSTVINEGNYTFFVGETYFYILPPEHQTNNRRFGTFVSLLDFFHFPTGQKNLVGYFVWSDRDPNTPYRRTDHGINLSSPDYIYVTPDGARYSTLTILTMREPPPVPFGKTNTYIFHPLIFGGNLAEITFTVWYAPNIFLYVPPNLGGVPLQLSTTVAPDTLYIGGQAYEWLTVAPPLSIPVYGKV